MVKSGNTKTTPLGGSISNACRNFLRIKADIGAQFRKRKASVFQFLADYLRSDSFMYGPLLTSPSSSLSTPSKKSLPFQHLDTGASDVGLFSNTREYAGVSAISAPHSPPPTPLPRLQAVNTQTRRVLGRYTIAKSNSNEIEVVPVSFSVGHKYREEQKGQIPDKNGVRETHILAKQLEDDSGQATDMEDRADDSSRSCAESQSDHDVTPLHKDAAKEVIRKLVKKLHGRLSRELGIFVDARDSDVEQWFLVTTFLSHLSEFESAKEMFKRLKAMGIRKIQDVLDYDQNKLEDLFESVMHQLSRLQKIAFALHEHGGIKRLKHMTEYAELKRELENLPGYGRSSAHMFLRELQGVWPGVKFEFDTHTRNAARHLHLIPTGKDGWEATSYLTQVAEEAGLDARDLEVALLKLSHNHARHYRNCTGGQECEFLRITLSDLDNLIANL
ncbi:hypothetical protein KP509_38G001300 [Ceratopteris richardii]|uniref:Uncharacterized protein n=1 Tax=Ceratopteris richardii TaxID=49495 RepID=A0A8T2Q1X2_CERRI|nr:hypothetical protein KP509_38G001300 [Ceratopteris richardii]